MILVLIFAIILAYTIFIYNKLVTKRNRVLTNFSSIDIMLNKRANLIPNLVESVKGYMSHELNTLRKIVETREHIQKVKPMSKKRFQFENSLGKQIGNVLLTVENYPNLKANENTMQLQQSLTEQEEQISAARRAYNSSVNQMNVAVETFPSNIVAKLFGFQQHPFFQAEEQVKTNPNIKF